ncbi:hypothetical protein J7K28_05760 [Candidatus Aerophobetes bacterium]|nr:hypothetical protein [Candidatus Aerophobetes bacterium]
MVIQRKRNRLVRYLFVFFVFSVISLGMREGETAQVKRSFLLFTQFTKIVVQRETELKLDVKVVNTGERAEDIYFSVIPSENAKTWEAGLKGLYGAVDVQAVHLSSESPDNSVILSFRTTPPREAPAGNYTFTIKAVTKDKKIGKSLSITLVLIGEAWKPIETPKPTSENIKLTVDYPQKKMPAGKNFEFEIEIKNDTLDDLVFDLIPIAPAGWGGYCTPRWREEQILAIKVKKRSSEYIKLVLIPPFNISEGEYPVGFKVRSGELSQLINLKAIVTGTYKLKMTTKTGRLNLNAIAGRKEPLLVYLWNEGSAPIDDISFFSNEPTGWKISFSPERLPSLLPIREIQKPEKVEVTIEPKAKAIPGDYMVTINAVGKQDRTGVDIRVTVGVSTTWGWIGIAIVVAIIAILTGVFIRLKRR